MEVKQGILTTEFWVSVIPTIVSLLVLTGVVGTSEVESVTGLFEDIIAGAVALFSIISYVSARTSLKREQIKLQGLNDFVRSTDGEIEIG